jgi:hypothetical protein
MGLDVLLIRLIVYAVEFCVFLLSPWPLASMCHGHMRNHSTCHMLHGAQRATLFEQHHAFELIQSYFKHELNPNFMVSSTISRPMKITCIS